MNNNAAIDSLRHNRFLSTPAEVAAFDQALASVPQCPRHEQLLALHSVFTDECQDHEVMFGLVHLLESFAMERQLRALVEVVPEMKVNAPEWVKILHYRVLNDDSSRACYKGLLHTASLSCQRAIASLLLEIQKEESQFANPVRELLAQLHASGDLGSMNGNDRMPADDTGATVG